MRQKLLLFLLFPFLQLNAQTPIFTPSMTINATGSYSSPATEGVGNIKDNDVNTKFLDFNSFDGFGFVVNATASNSYAVNRIDITTANDSQERDPTFFEVAGSATGASYTVIATGSIPCISNRFFTRTFNFTNTTAYNYYRVNFLTQCNSIEQMFQLAEVQLYGALLSNSDFSFNANSVSVSPNPSNGLFTIKNSGTEMINKVVLTDLMGKIVKEQAFTTLNTEQEVNVSGILSGIYFVKISSADKEVVKKLIIK